MSWLLLLLAPAYAEVNCQTGSYTGQRYNYANEAFEPKEYLYGGGVWYKGTYPINRYLKHQTAEYRPQNKTRCLYS